MSKFRETLRASLKSNDTEEWIDLWFTRPVGLLVALACRRLGIRPNAVTIFSIFLGAASGFMFSYPDVGHNIAGVLLLMSANFLDSADGQLARLTNHKTLTGRILDGFSGDVWFFAIYFGICCRLMGVQIPGADISWGIWIWVLAFIAGVMCHSPQASLADYYRQIYLFFLKGKQGSELDTYAEQRRIYDSIPKKGHWLEKAFYFNYSNYCRSQERRTRCFQKMMAAINEKYGDASLVPDVLRNEFLAKTKPLLKYTNILTFNIRAISLYVTCLLGCPWVHFIIEITVMNFIYVYMQKRHEKICLEITRTLQG